MILLLYYDTAVYLTIIPRARFGYKIRDKRRVGFNHLISNKHEWNYCFTKNNQEILPDLADFALQEQPEDNFMVVISLELYNGSYTMAAKPIKSLELYYDQFLINRCMFSSNELRFSREYSTK